MKIRGHRWYWRLVGAASILWIQPASAQATCSGKELAAYAAGQRAIATWARDQNTFVPPALAQAMVNSFCATARAVIREGKATQPTVAAAAPATMQEYLTTYTNLKIPTRTIGAILRSRLGAQGFSRPVARALGIVRMTYRQRGVDRLLFGTVRADATGVLLVPIGEVQFSGFRANQIVCTARVNVVADQPISLTC